MRLMTDKVRLQIDLALAEVDEIPSAGATARRQLLAPPEPAPATERSRPTLVAPDRALSTRVDLRSYPST